MISLGIIISTNTHIKGAYSQVATENNKRTLRRLAIVFFQSEPILYKKEYRFNTTSLRRRPRGKGNHRGKATLYSSIMNRVVAKFIKRDIISRYELPTRIITYNKINMNNEAMTKPCEPFKAKHHNPTPYRPKINWTVGAANKNIKKIVQKMVVI
ncbi:hypothetical protein CR513_28316, partial [Mucuna pruriens]